MEINSEDIKIIQKYNNKEKLNEIEKSRIITITNQLIIDMLTKIYTYKNEKE